MTPDPSSYCVAYIPNRVIAYLFWFFLVMSRMRNLQERATSEGVAQNMKRWFAWFPVPLALFPVLFLFARNMDMVSWSETVIPLVIALSGLLLFWGLFLLLTRDSGRASLLAAFWIVMCQSFQPIDAISQEPLLLLGFLLLLGTLLVLRLKKINAQLMQALNIASIVLIALPMGKIACQELRGVLAPPPIRSSTQMGAGSSGVGEDGVDRRPNIYHFVLDAYARGDVLRSLYGYDNGAFLSAIRARGFFVADRARTNYWRTIYSFASTLNLSHITFVNGLNNYIQTGMGERGNLDDLIRESFVVRYLEGKGYTLVTFPTGFPRAEIGGKGVIKLGVKSEGISALAPFHQACLNLTFVPKALRQFFSRRHTFCEAQRKRILNAFDRVGTISDRRAPLFVFAHVIAPHPPFVFAADGSPPATQTPCAMLDGSSYLDAGCTPEEYRALYVDELRFINEKVLEAIDRIEANSTRPTVIILQSDHGPGAESDWSHPEKSNFFERIPILLAIRLPGEDNPELSPDFTPVNLYPMLFSTFFRETSPDLQILLITQPRIFLSERYKFPRALYLTTALRVPDRLLPPSTRQGNPPAPSPAVEVHSPTVQRSMTTSFTGRSPGPF